MKKVIKTWQREQYKSSQTAVKEVDLHCKLENFSGHFIRQVAC